MAAMTKWEKIKAQLRRGRAMLGGAVATLTDTAEFTANEIYEIQQTDSVEGAAPGASFSGIGVANQPHQQLANRTAFLKGRQDVNIGNIATLLAFMGEFTSLLAANGYLKIPVTDINLGERIAIIQWGSFFPSGGDGDDVAYTIDWPIAFPNACVWAATCLSNSQGIVNTGKLEMEVQSFNKNSGVFRSDKFSAAIAGSAVPNDGFYWISIGF